LPWGLVEVCEDWMGRKLRPKPEDGHAVRIKLSNDLDFQSQETKVVLPNKSSLVVLVMGTIASNAHYGKWAAWTPVVQLPNVRTKAADTRLGKKSFDFGFILCGTRLPVSFPFLEVHVATRV
jgi:hypothetical protein